MKRNTCYRCGVATVPQYDPEVDTQLCEPCLTPLPYWERETLAPPMTPLESALADLDALLALAKSKPFPEWSVDVIGFLSERRYALWQQVMAEKAAA